MDKPPVVIWGFRSEYMSQKPNVAIASHAYIHAGYAKAFEALGYFTKWLDDAPGNDELIPSGAIVFCMDCRLKHAPIRPDLFYIGHNLTSEQNSPIKPHRRIALQYLFKDCPGAPHGNAWTKWDEPGRTLYQPWATDLLPNEIGRETYAPMNRVVYWTGSVWSDKGAGVEMGNKREFQELRQALAKHNIELKHVRPLDNQQAEYIRNSYIAPAMQSLWQVEKGYIPCRSFKNVSYGQMLITNNPAVRDMFHGYCAYGETVEAMVDAAIGICCEPRAKLTRHAMTIVKENHTYVHRVNSLMKIVEGML